MMLYHCPAFQSRVAYCLIVAAILGMTCLPNIKSKDVVQCKSIDLRLVRFELDNYIDLVTVRQSDPRKFFYLDRVNL